MSITTAIERIQNSVEDIKNSIENKGVTVPAGSKVDDLADLVDQITAGEGNYQSKTVDASTNKIIVRPDHEDTLLAIVSDGSVYFRIPSGIDGRTQRYKYEVKYYWPGPVSTNVVSIIGSGDSRTSDPYMSVEYRDTTTYGTSGYHLTLNYNREHNTTGPIFEPNIGIHTASMECTVVGSSVNGKVIYTLDDISQQITQQTNIHINSSNIGLFCEYRDTTGARYKCPANTRIYYFKMWVDDTLVYDYQPAYYNNRYCFHNNVDDTYLNSQAGTPTGYYAPYDALSSVTVNPVTAAIDSDIKAANIKKGVNILGVTGTLEAGSTINNQNKSVNPSTSSQSVTYDSGYTGLGTVTVNPVTASIDSDIVAGNIKKNVNILGVTGTYEGASINNQDKTVDTSTNIQRVTADTGYTGLGTVTVNPAEYQDKTVDASTGAVVVRPDIGEVTAIVSDGNTVFNTGITLSGADNMYKYEVKYYWAGGTGDILGGDEDDDELVKVGYDYLCYSQPRATGGGMAITQTVGEHTVIMDCVSLSSGGAVRYTFDDQKATVLENTKKLDEDTPLGLFCTLEWTGSQPSAHRISAAGTRICYFKLWVNEVLSYDFEPAFHNGQYCFHDVINNTYIYATQGTPTGYYDNGYDALSTVTVNPVTANIDANIQPENIVKDVTILGVTGTATGGGGVSDVLVNNESVVENNVAKITIPTNVSAFNNDAGYITDSSLGENVLIFSQIKNITAQQQYNALTTLGLPIQNISLNIIVEGDFDFYYYPEVMVLWYQNETQIRNDYSITAAHTTIGFCVPTGCDYEVRLPNITGYTSPTNITGKAARGPQTLTATYQEAGWTDLSMVDINGNTRLRRETANCYVIHQAGYYEIPLAYGAAIKNGSTNSDAYTQAVGNDTAPFYNYLNRQIRFPWIEQDTNTEAASVSWVYYDPSEGVNLMNPILHKKQDGYTYIRFHVSEISTTCRGANKILAIKDSLGRIMWSWHIWIYPFELSNITHIYEYSNTLQLLDVTLGWVKDTLNEDDNHGTAPFYQWGRKDPLLRARKYDNSERWSSDQDYGLTVSEVATSVATAIQNPTTFYKMSSSSNDNWWIDGTTTKNYYNYWDGAMTGTGKQSMNVVKKTVYDPCPVGYAIPAGKAFHNYSQVSGTWDYGCTFKDPGTETIYIPASGARGSQTGTLESVGEFGNPWVSASRDSVHAYNFWFRDGGLDPNGYDGRARALPVRPMVWTNSGQ